MEPVTFFLLVKNKRKETNEMVRVTKIVNYLVPKIYGHDSPICRAFSDEDLCGLMNLVVCV